MFANSQMLGLDAGFPDVGLTPAPPSPVPTPFPNTAMSVTDIPAAMNVLVGGASPMQSLLPNVDPSVSSGGISPGPLLPSIGMPALPQSFLPPSVLV